MEESETVDVEEAVRDEDGVEVSEGVCDGLGVDVWLSVGVEVLLVEPVWV